MTPASDQAREGIAVLEEQDASLALLRAGVRLLRAQRFASEDLEPVLALLAPGLERLSKLVLGAVMNTDEQRWPTDQEWRAWGHQVTVLTAEVDAALAARRPHGGAPGWVGQLQERVQARRAVLDPLLAVIDAWAKATGRYENFAALTRRGAMPTHETPRGLWHDLTNNITNADYDRFKGLAGTQEDWNAAISDLHNLLADAVVAWVDVVVVGWNVGTVGPRFKQMQISDLTWPRPVS